LSPGEITELLRAWENADKAALDRMMPLVLQQLRVFARRQLGPNHQDNTLQTTALVNEAYLRFARSTPELKNREHFFAFASRVMRQILTDYARTRLRKKRGAGALVLPLQESMDPLSPEQVEQIISLDELLGQLEAFDERKCRIFEMRFFAGLSVAETAAAAGVSENTVIRDWDFSCTWLRHALTSHAKVALV
jgi:RNA polymerase sigma factor (TIGR02999 family)